MSQSSPSLTPGEWRSIGGLCGVFFLRMLGLFLVLPILSPYASSLEGARPILIGLAVGAFPLTQTLFQVPFGWLSDHIGRKPIIVVGLLLFATGSAIAAVASSIITLILGFCIQGAGAIGSVVVALLADLTRDSVRTRAMAMIGGSVGLALGIGFVFGPLISSYWSVPSLFVIIGVLSLLAVPAVLYLVPTPDKFRSDSEGLSLSRLKGVLKDDSLWRLNTGVFTANATLRALFVVIPFFLASTILGEKEWLVYLMVLLVSGIVMFPTIFVAERKGKIRLTLFASVAIVGLSLVVFPLAGNRLDGLLLGLTLYFIGFSLIEAILPSLVTQLSGENDRGTAMGIFNMSQYLGAFVGSLYGGIFLRGSGASTEPWAITWMFAGLLLLLGAWSFYLVGLKTGEVSMRR
ncbi:MAG: MFS transporter [bacterium]